jgi:formate hydrogenlyase subunit 3/multisubunit Na+/H+ antiporter MnhD subunit
MSTPLVWIVFPGIAAVILFLIRRWDRGVIFAGALVSASLAWLAWLAPFGERVRFGPINLQMVDTLEVLGRRFTLGMEDRPLLILVYLAVAIWFGGAVVARTDRLFVPMGLGIAALLTAALAVEPFLYAALLIEMAALVSIPLLVSPGGAPGRGVIRFLVFQTLGMPFLLFSGWALDGLEANPGNSDLMFQASLLMGLGFAFFLGVFPFHTWIPMLAEESHPYAAAFVFFLLPLVISLFGLNFLEGYLWLRTSTGLYDLLRTAGALMVGVVGVWAAFQRSLGRMMGYAVMFEIGLSLLALGAGSDVGESTRLRQVFFALLLPRGLALCVWALALTIIREKTGDLRFRSVQGVAHSLPVAAGGLLLAHFSMAGFPLLAGFTVHLALWDGLANLYPFSALAALFGSAGLLMGGLRTLAVLVTGTAEQTWQKSESWGQNLLLGMGCAALFIMGLLPQWFLPIMTRLAEALGQPGQ